jgi:tetratricopeptide (TPR) repeat protein
VALRLGSPRRALEHLERALADHRAAFGRAKPSTAAVLHLRGDAYRVAGDFPAAQASYRQAREIRSKALGEAHAETARTSNAIGVLRADLGDWQGADDAFAQALATLEAALGREHPETLTVGSNRALARWGATESADAAQAYAQVVEALGRALGEEHPSVAAALRNLARIELERGRTEQAAKLLERTLAVQSGAGGRARPRAPAGGARPHAAREDRRGPGRRRSRLRAGRPGLGRVGELHAPHLRRHLRPPAGAARRGLPRRDRGAALGRARAAPRALRGTASPPRLGAAQHRGNPRCECRRR